MSAEESRDAGRMALIMVDDRAPTSRRPRASRLSYPALAFALNSMYACGHGYDLIYYRMVSPSCAHVSQGERRISYCKLPAIAHALSLGYAAVAFIDSDSWIRVDQPLFQNLTLPALIRTYSSPLGMPPPAWSSSGGAGGGPSAWFACDLPQLGDRPNGGFHIWRNSDDARALLHTWWHAPAGRYATEHDYEQHVLQWHLSHLGPREGPPPSSAAPRPASRSSQGLQFGPLPPANRGPARATSTLQLKAMDDQFRHAVAHVDHTKAGRRLGLFAAALLRAALLRPASDAENRAGWRDGDVAVGAIPQAAGGAAGRDGPRVDVVCWPDAKQRASLRRLVALADASSPEAAAPAVVHRLLRAVAKLLQPNAAAVHFGMLAPAAGSGAAGVPQGAACGRGGSRLRQIEYNATATALALLPTTGVALPPVGSPLALRECIYLSRDQAGAAAKAGAPAGGRVGASQAWLQLEAGRLAMAARPGLCARVGPAKAPKTPYSMLAQIGQCGGDGSRSRGSDSALDSVSLSLTLKPSLPAHAAGQGAEAAVVGGMAGLVVRTRDSTSSVARALARAAAGTGSAGVESGGLSESYGRRLARSARQPGASRSPVEAPRGALWQDGLMSVDGAGGEQGDGALCLAAWRGKLADGAPLVWSSCETGGTDGGRLGAKKLPAPLRWEAIESPGGGGALMLRVAARGSRELCLTADIVG